MAYLRTWLATTLALVSVHASALQTVEPVEGHNAFVKISAKEVTRLVIDGGKISSLIATDGELSVEKDAERGQLFIRPVVLNKPINVRLLAASGATYNLVMQAVDIPQEDIIIREPFAVRADKASRALQGPSGKAAAGGLPKAVRNLVAAMALDEPPNTIDVRPTSQEFALWDNTRFVMTAVYSERDLIGEKYVLSNVGHSVIRMAEQELYRKGVVAVAIENMQLEPGQSTNVYVVRSN